jgi:hypothetical protein
VTFTPSRASEMAQACPSPLLAPHTSADLPRMPRSMLLPYQVLRDPAITLLERLSLS